MLKFAANLTSLFTELPMAARLAAAQDAGFDAVEIQYPYETPAMEIRNALGLTGLPLILINAPPPNYTGGTAGFAALKGGKDRFQHDFLRALRYAEALGARHVHVMSGAAWGDEATGIMVDNLKWACAHAPQQSLTIEPMNAGDLQGYFMSSFDLAAEVIAAVDAPNLGLQFDTYHAHKITGNIMETWREFSHLVRHVQVAGTPGQHEPDGDRIDFAAFYEQLVASGYDGWVGADYRPRGTTTEGLGWLAEPRAGLAAQKKPA